MALADTAKLIVALNLDDNLTPGLKKAQGASKRFGASMDGAGKKVGAFAGKIKTAGAIAGGVIAGGLIVGIKSGLQSLGELESATTSVEAALKQMGKAGDVTAAQVADWANEIEAATDAAFDDKAITAATTTLIRFGKVTTKNLRPAMEVMTDLAAKTGDVNSAAELLSKALAAPEKAAGRLTRQGIILTEAQQKQIKAFVKAGETGKAQAIVLDAIAKSTKGAAAAMNGPYVDAQRKLDDAIEDGTKLLAQGFLPLITEVADTLREAVSDPGTQADIKEFGKALAGGFKSALTFVKQIPWGAIKDGLKTAAQWAGRLMDAFKSLPPEAQATIVALAGLNKLSGGAVTGIVSELGKGLIKGVLSMNAGVVNINAASVNGGGGVGVPGATGGAAGAISTGVQVAGLAALGVAIAAAAKTATDQLSTVLANGDAQAASFWRQNFDLSRAQSLQGFELLRQVPEHVDTVSKWVQSLTNQTATSGAQTVASVNAAKNAISATERGEGAKHRAAVAQVVAKQRDSIIAYRAGERATQSAVNNSKNALAGRLNTANQRLAQIRAKRTVFTTNVSVRTAVSVRNVNNSVTTSNRYGSKTLSQAS